MDIKEDWTPWVRALDDDDRGALQGHYIRLDRVSRMARFRYNIPVERMEAYAQRLALSNSLVVGCFPDRSLRGVVECRPMGLGTSAIWETVVTVERDWQDRGMATALLRAALEAAKTRGIQRLYLRCDFSNVLIRKMMQRFNARFEETDGECVACIAVSDEEHPATSRPSSHASQAAVMRFDMNAYDGRLN